MSNFAHANKGTTYTVNHYLATKHIGIWCNGNTTDSGPVILGSSPSIPTNEKVQQIDVAPFCVIRHFILIDYVYATVHNKCRSNQ